MVKCQVSVWLAKENSSLKGRHNKTALGRSMKQQSACHLTVKHTSCSLTNGVSRCQWQWNLLLSSNVLQPLLLRSLVVIELVLNLYEVVHHIKGHKWLLETAAVRFLTFIRVSCNIPALMIAYWSILKLYTFQMPHIPNTDFFLCKVAQAFYTY